MDQTSAQTSRAHVGLLLAKGKLVGCLTTTGQSPRSCTVDAATVNDFHSLLQLAIRDTTTRESKEFKKCIAWIVCHVTKSRRSVAAFGDYLQKLFDSLLSSSPQSHLDHFALLQAHTAIHILHLLDAVFFRIRENPARLLRKPLETYSTFAKAIESTVFRFVELAAPLRGLGAIRVHQDLACLLDHWTQSRLFTNRIRLGLRNVARKAYIDWLDWLQTNHHSHYHTLIIKVPPEDVQNDFPKTHGMPEDAWFDLPVGSMVHAMKSTKPGHPIHVGRIKPLKMPVGSVDPDMMETVLEHIEECKKINSIPNVPTTNDDNDFILNGLGLRLKKDPMISDDRPKLKVVEGYYGFSVPFMKMYQNIEKKPPPAPERPQNWMPPPPEFIQPPPYHTNFSHNVPPPPSSRDMPQMGGGGGGNYRQGDFGHGNGTGWRGGDARGGGGGGGNWRGRGRGWNGGGGGHRPY